MERLTIFQVGDVHFPEHNRPDADVKDDLLSGPLVKAATTSELQAATRALLRSIPSAINPMLVVTGDVTSRGDLAQYDRGVEFLAGALLLADKTQWDHRQLHVVPGNHDVNRVLASSAPTNDLFWKFRPLEQAWTNVGVPVIATDSVRVTEWPPAKPTVRVMGVNSCLGCGEGREHPAVLRQQLATAMASAGIDGGVADQILVTAFDETNEVIDTPAFAETHVDQVCDTAREAGHDGLTVVVAHHNLLQQALPRFALYTDLLNAGLFRSRVSSLRLPILYLHGHIHSDPVEIVSQLAPDHGQLVCVSAPEFHEGFNRIELTFADNGMPIGCVVRRIRVRLHGGEAEEPSVRIKFLSSEATLSEAAMLVAQTLMNNPNSSNIADLRAANEAAFSAASDDDLGDALEEIEWLDLVEIVGRERPRKSWRIRGVAQLA